MDESTRLVPCAQPDDWIIQVAESLAQREKFTANADIMSVVSALRGKVEYVDPDDIFPDKAVITVHKKPVDLFKFVIQVSMLTFPLQERYSIAHELGHYILHSDCGQKEIRATESQHYNEHDIVEREANIFASAFLMSRTDIEKMTPANERRIASHFGVPLVFARNWLSYLDELNAK